MQMMTIEGKYVQRGARHNHPTGRVEGHGSRQSDLFRPIAFPRKRHRKNRMVTSSVTQRPKQTAVRRLSGEDSHVAFRVYRDTKDAPE